MTGDDHRIRWTSGRGSNSSQLTSKKTIGCNKGVAALHCIGAAKGVNLRRFISSAARIYGRRIRPSVERG
jgi:hypothetical protein